MVKVDNVIALAADEFLVKFKLLVAGLLCVLEAGSSERARQVGASENGGQE